MLLVFLCEKITAGGGQIIIITALWCGIRICDWWCKRCLFVCLCDWIGRGLHSFDGLSTEEGGGAAVFFALLQVPRTHPTPVWMMCVIIMRKCMNFKSTTTCYKPN